MDLVHLFGVHNAIAAPVAPGLRSFAAELAAVDAQDPALRRGARVWAEIAAERLYCPEPSFCEAIWTWRSAGFAASTRPVEPAILTSLERQGERQAATARATAKRLRRLGVRPATAGLFTLDALTDSACA